MAGNIYGQTIPNLSYAEQINTGNMLTEAGLNNFASNNANQIMSNAQVANQAGSTGFDWSNFMGTNKGTTNNYYKLPEEANGFSNFAKGAAGVSSLANVWLGYENLGVAKDQQETAEKTLAFNISEQEKDRAYSLARQKAASTGVSQYS